MMTEGKIRHGEAVAIGLLLDSFYAVKIGLLDKEILDAMVDAFREMKLPMYDEVLSIQDENGKYSILKGIEEFREHLGGELHITLPDGIGRKIEVSSMDENIIIEGIEWLKKLET